MSIVNFVWDRDTKSEPANRRHVRWTGVVEGRVALLEREVSDLEVICKTLLGVVRQAGLLTDEKVDSLLQRTAKDAAAAADPIGQRLPQKQEM